jgi:hypothetical protein
VKETDQFALAITNVDPNLDGLQLVDGGLFQY